MAFISVLSTGERRHSFQDFQDLDPILQIVLARGTEEQIQGHERTVAHLREYIRLYHHNNHPKNIIQLYDELAAFTSNTIRCRMVRCYVDHDCNMLQAKLAWREDY